ncbi:MAG: alpha/beta fold hydrolase [Bdellovibrionaceae bacterium]|nr:alpha/beta fold hydrolase [Pseudobdellovibrionaceae bacterium]
MNVSVHFHTLLAHFLPSPILTAKGERHLIRLDDGDQIAGYLHAGTSDYVVSLFHGLTGDSDADYMQRTAILYLAKGHSVFLVNHRGVDPAAGPTKEPYHSGRGEDISQVIGYLRKLMPSKKQIAVGFSMSGNMVLFLLAGRKGTELPDGAITVNAPINLQACSILLGQGFNRVYDLRFVRRLISRYEIKLSRWSKLIEVDDKFTAPLSGFKSGQEYYDICSSKPHVQNIQVPTQVMAAEDDPFIPAQDYREAAWPANVEVKIHPRGGHLGYMLANKNEFGNRRGLDSHMVENLDKLIRKIEVPKG